jgi:hypothetical protein
MILRCLLSCCCAFAFGQPKEPDLIRCTFRALAWSEPLEDAAYQVGRRSTPFLIPSDFFSAPQAYRGSSDVKFGRLADEILTKPAGPDEAGLEAIRRADAAHDELAQEAAALMAGAPEGPLGEARRRQAESLLTKAAEQAARAAQAREAARREQESKPAAKEPKVLRRATKELRFVPQGQARLKDGGTYLLLFAVTTEGWRVTALEESPDAHPFGTLRFLHFGEKPLRVIQGGREYALQAGNPLILRPLTDEYGYAAIELRPTDPSARPLRTLRIYPEKDARSTYLVGDHPSGGLNVKAVHERRAP